VDYQLFLSSSLDLVQKKLAIYNLLCI